MKLKIGIHEQKKLRWYSKVKHYINLSELENNRRLPENGIWGYVTIEELLMSNEQSSINASFCKEIYKLK